MRIAAIVAGAGSGTRLGANMPKALVPLTGEPLLVHAVRSMHDAGIASVVVTAPADVLGIFESVLVDARLPARVVAGGATRQASVAVGLAAVDADAVLIHDAARALTPPAMIKRVIAALESGESAVVPGVPVIDTIKAITGADAYVERTVDRDTLRSIQTPQGFDVALLRAAHAYAIEQDTDGSLLATDDAFLVEYLAAAGKTEARVKIVDGAQEAMKVTTAFDLAVAEILARQGEETARHGEETARQGEEIARRGAESRTSGRGI